MGNPSHLYISMSDRRRDALNLRVPYPLARILMRFGTVVSAEACEAFGRPGERVLRLSDLPKEELEARLRSGIFLSSAGCRFRMYSE